MSKNNLSGNEWSTTWRADGLVYKRQHEFMTRNEYYFLLMLGKTGYVPSVQLIDANTIATDFIPLSPITNIAEWLRHLPILLDVLGNNLIRHGDLTRYAVRVQGNKPILIDFSESRWLGDPMPDKRPEGDRYWLTKTMHEMVGLDAPSDS